MGKLACFALLLLAGCGGVSADPGVSAWMRVSGASFIEGTIPEGQGGPAIVSVDLSNDSARAGQINKPLRGALDPSATAGVIGLAHDKGYWIVPAGLPDVQAPDFPTFDVKLSFAPDMSSGLYDLVLCASDADGKLGPPTIRTLAIEGAPQPTGALIVSFAWDVEADLDLRVVDPEGIEIWKRNINSIESAPPGEPVDPSAWQKGGLLDFDSNAACVIDGRRREHVIWKSAPPPGHYIVRVDTPSLCAEPFARWNVEVRHNEQLLGRAEGTSGPADEAMPHDRGAGVLALEFDVP